MTAGFIYRLNENQIALVQKSIEYLYNIQDQETLVKSIVLEASYLIGGGKALFLIYDQSLKQLIPYSNTNIAQKEVKQLTAETKELFSNKMNQDKDYVHNCNYWFFPYKRNNQFSGVLALLPNEQPLLREQLKMIDIFMQSVPIILENSSLYLMMQRKTKSLSLMSQLHQLVNRYSFQEILAEVVEKIGDMLDSEMAGIMLYNPDSNDLTLQKPAFGNWNSSMIEQYRVSISGHSNAKSVFLTGVPSITIDAENDANYNQEFVKLFHAKSIVTIPLIVEDKRIGVMHAINKKNQGFFTQVDVHTLMEIAEQLGTLLQGALQLSTQNSSRQNRTEIEQYLSAQLIDLLITNPADNQADIGKICQTLGFELSSRMSVMAVKFSGDQYVLKWIKEHVDDIRTKISIFIPTALTNYMEGIFYIIAGHEEELQTNKLGNQLSTKLKEFINKRLLKGKQSSFEIYIGIGESVKSINDVPDSYIQAKQILNALPRMRNNGNIGYYPSCGSWTLLSDVAANEDTVIPFIKHYLDEINQMKDAEIMKETLESYLKNNGQFNKAAEDLFVHANTLKYRIEKIQDITGLDLTDSEIRLNLNLALRLEQLLNQ